MVVKIARVHIIHYNTQILTATKKYMCGILYQVAMPVNTLTLMSVLTIMRSRHRLATFATERYSQPTRRFSPLYMIRAQSSV